MHGLSPETLFAGYAALLFAVAGFDIGIAFLVLGVRGSSDDRDRGSL